MIRTNANERPVLAVEVDGSVMRIAFPNIMQAPQLRICREGRTRDRSEARTEPDPEEIENENDKDN